MIQLAIAVFPTVGFDKVVKAALLELALSFLFLVRARGGSGLAYRQ
jgi:hypothetical protein